jgi:hypothetical protein
VIFKRTECPICGNPEQVPIFEVDATNYVAHDKAFPDTKTWVGCHACGHAYTVEAWDRAQFGEYAQGEPFQLNEEWSEGRFAYSCDLMREFLTAFPDAKSLLEPGSGRAYFSAAAVDFGLKATAVDPFEQFREETERIGAKFVKGFMEDLDLEPHDIVAMGDILEHCTDPHEAISKLPIGEHGLLHISTPRLDSAYYRGTKWMGMWFVSDHMHFFSNQSLTRLVEQYGWKLVDYQVGKAYKGCGAWTFVR